MSKSEFKAKALELLRQVEADGNPLIVTDHGKPFIEVRRYRPVVMQGSPIRAGTL